MLRTESSACMCPSRSPYTWIMREHSWTVERRKINITNYTTVNVHAQRVSERQFWLLWFQCPCESVCTRACTYSLENTEKALFIELLSFFIHMFTICENGACFFFSELFALAVIHTDAWIQNNTQSLSVACDNRIGRRSGEIGTNVNTIEESRIMLITCTELHSHRHIHTQRHPHSCMAVLYNRIDVWLVSTIAHYSKCWSIRCVCVRE